MIVTLHGWCGDRLRDRGMKHELDGILLDYWPTARGLERRKLREESGEAGVGRRSGMDWSTRFPGRSSEGLRSRNHGIRGAPGVIHDREGERLERKKRGREGKRSGMRPAA